MLASTPIWVTMINSLLERKLPSLRLALSMVFGFAGIVVLMGHSIGSTNYTGSLVALLLLAATLNWSLGSVYQSRNQQKISATVISAYQHLFAGLGFVLCWIIAGEPFPHPSIQAWIGWGYLVIFGSVLGYTSFVKTLELLPINIAMTYSYVNPVLALLLGWLLLNEQISSLILIGAAMVVLGVVGVFRNHQVNVN